jgi:hypothetical protein
MKGRLERFLEAIATALAAALMLAFLGWVAYRLVLLWPPILAIALWACLGANYYFAWRRGWRPWYPYDNL